MGVRRGWKRFKRYAFVGASVGTVIAVRRAKTRRDTTPHLGPVATWPPLQPSEEPVAATGDLATDPDSVRSESRPAATSYGQNGENGDPAWVEPVDGACPVSHPIKVNATSGIFHTPGGRFYERTRPDRCYTDAATAEADGYRAAKGA
jgi:hypothetical protein